MQSEFGIIGLGVMGKSLALNLASKGVKLSVYNRNIPGKEVDIAQNLVQEFPDLSLSGFDNLEAFVHSLASPKKILLMITAGEAVDQQIEALLPGLKPGDVILDGGNSFFKDSSRRTKLLANEHIHFLGTGVSGGEEGALKGPSIMPGGTMAGYNLVEKYLNLIAAKDKNGLPCTTYIGPEGAGHFVKMVHNGIEYAEMQLLAEVYTFLKDYMQLPVEEIVTELKSWQNSDLGSYLLEITLDIIQYQENDEFLLDKILDKAEQKGTGWLSAATALEYGVPYDVLAQAVMARSISALKSDRVKASEYFGHQVKNFSGAKSTIISSLKDVYRLVRYINHDNGFELIQKVSQKNHWNLNLSELARIWTNGCIIRSELMEELVQVFKQESRILFAPELREHVLIGKNAFSIVLCESLKADLALPVISAAHTYLLSQMTAKSSANLIQAQRDYFGAHTYQRVDGVEGQYYHSNWKK
mgnify:CR=1 FL=1